MKKYQGYYAALFSPHLGGDAKIVGLYDAYRNEKFGWSIDWLKLINATWDRQGDVHGETLPRMELRALQFPDRAAYKKGVTAWKRDADLSAYTVIEILTELTSESRRQIAADLARLDAGKPCYRGMLPPITTVAQLADEWRLNPRALRSTIRRSKS